MPAVSGQTGNGLNDAAQVIPVTGTAPRSRGTDDRTPGPGDRPGEKVTAVGQSRTERDLLAYDSDVPYAAVEDANRRLVCALIERQDRVTEKLLLMINDLEYRVDDLELSPGTGENRRGRSKKRRRHDTG